MKKLSLLALSLVLFSTPSFSQTEFTQSFKSEHIDPFFVIDTVEIRRLPEAEEQFRTDEVVLPEGVLDPMSGGTVVQITQVINLGKEIWKMIEKNRPVVNLKTDFATALPKGVRSAGELEGWKRTESAVYEVSYKNIFRITTVRLKLRLVYTYGGSYQGQGKYLAYVSVDPIDLYVAWGYKFNANSSFPETLNVGTKANPVGGIRGMVSWEIDTVMSHAKGSTSFFVDGLGNFKDLDNF